MWCGVESRGVGRNGMEWRPCGLASSWVLSLLLTKWLLPGLLWMFAVTGVAVVVVVVVIVGVIGGVVAVVILLCLIWSGESGDALVGNSGGGVVVWCARGVVEVLEKATTTDSENT